MRCKNCPNEFKTTIKTRNRKYCDSCKPLVWNLQKRNWKRVRITHDCIDCGISLEDKKFDRRRCDVCRDERIKRIKRDLHRKRISQKYKLEEKINCEICNEVFYSIKGVRIHDKLVHKERLITN